MPPGANCLASLRSLNCGIFGLHLQWSTSFKFQALLIGMAFEAEAQLND